MDRVIDLDKNWSIIIWKYSKGIEVTLYYRKNSISGVGAIRYYSHMRRYEPNIYFSEKIPEHIDKLYRAYCYANTIEF